mmetsp:Transcript_34981/g.85720  ORF Transcript_34981/g.85720 Transcript_34981/m.85720 type:complete len:502 (-) Transcript_34981:498-2003(-)
MARDAKARPLSSLDWLETVDEDDEDEYDVSGPGGRQWRRRWNSPKRCLRGASALVFGSMCMGKKERPELERIKALRTSLIKTTNALSAPFLHMSAYLMYFVFELSASGYAIGSSRVCIEHYTEHVPRFLGMTVLPLGLAALVLNKGWWRSEWGDPSIMWVVTTVMENLYMVVYNVTEYPCSDKARQGYKVLDEDIYGTHTCAGNFSLASFNLASGNGTGAGAGTGLDGGRGLGVNTDTPCEITDLRSRFEKLHQFIFIISLASMLAGNVLWNPPFRVYVVGVSLDLSIVLGALVYEFAIGEPVVSTGNGRNRVNMEAIVVLYGICVVVLLAGLNQAAKVKGKLIFYRDALDFARFKRMAPPSQSRDVFLVETDIQGSTNLWEELSSSVMRRSIDMHNKIMRGLIAVHFGWEVGSEGDAFVVAFHEVTDAAAFCIDVQLSMLNAMWPQALMMHNAAGLVEVGGSSGGGGGGGGCRGGAVSEGEGGGATLLALNDWMKSEFAF